MRLPEMKREASYNTVKGRKDYECIYCGKSIPKNTHHFIKKYVSPYIGDSLEVLTGKSIWEIKKKTKFWYVDHLTLRFCTSTCMYFYSFPERHPMPKETEKRLRREENRIVNKVYEAISLVVALKG